jgi:hypothetical protein
MKRSKAVKRSKTKAKPLDVVKKAVKANVKQGKKGQNNPWIMHVMKVFDEMKRVDKNIQYKDAVIEARKSWNPDKSKKSKDSWNVSTSKYSTVTTPPKQTWNVDTADYSTVTRGGEQCGRPRK